MATEVSEEETRQRLSILVIEQNLDDSRKVSNYLIRPDVDHHGLSDVTISSTQYVKEAEKILASKKVDLVLMSLHLPDGEGSKLIRRISSKFPKIPVVAMTDKDSTDVATEVLFEGAQDYIRKDTMDGPMLFRSIQYALNKQKLAMELQNKRDALSISSAELAAISDIAGRGLETPIAKLRVLTEQLEDSIVRARGAIEPSNSHNDKAVKNDRRQQLITELSDQMPSAIEMIKTHSMT
jgi:DNA-binding response OmpR family regulator